MCVDCTDHRIYPRVARSVLAVLTFVVLMTACSPPPHPVSEAVPAPSVTRAGAAQAISMYYVTDRQRQGGSTGATYGKGRSASMAFGALSPTGNGRDGPTFDAFERVRFPPTPVPFSQAGGRILPDPVSTSAYAAQSRAFQQRMAAALRTADVRDVVVFIHGFNNSFNQAVTAAASLQSQVQGSAIVLVFSWPAGAGGLTGYFEDRESGEFSVFHLKEMLRLLAGVPRLRNIHVVAHSRGAAVTTTALREMVIAARASGRLPRQVLRVENLVLAAPDIDFGIVGQRLIAEQFGPAFGRISVYMNPADGALGASQSLLSGTRFGRLTFDDLDQNERVIFTRIRNVDFIDVENVVRGNGHSYFRKNPSVLSDISTVTRLSVPPSDSHRRLAAAGVNFWRIMDPVRTGRVSPGADRR